jgi:GLPGLI family protein
MRKFQITNQNNKECQFRTVSKKNILVATSLILLFFSSGFYSCSKKPDSKSISEGEIEYNIEYLDNERDNPLIMLLPKRMSVLFKNNSSYNQIEGFLGTFKLTYILNDTEQKNYTLFQLMDKKYYSQTDANTISFGFQNMNNVKIEYSDKEKKIAGYNCKGAIIKFENSEQKDIEVYFTDDIAINNPNQNTPFSEIKGVLMEFTMNLMGVNMRIKTKKVLNKKIEPEIFEVPENFTKVSPKELEEIVNSYNLKMDKQN